MNLHQSPVYTFHQRFQLVKGRHGVPRKNPILPTDGFPADDDFGVQFDETVYALAATTIDLCLAVFPWARFRKTKQAIKRHSLLDLRGNIPSVISITQGRIHEVNILDLLCPETGTVYPMDPGYLDVERLFALKDIAQALPVRQLSERHTQELIKACKRADAVVASISLDTPPELSLRQKVDELGEHGLSLIHEASPFARINPVRKPYRSLNQISNRGHLQMVYFNNVII